MHHCVGRQAAVGAGSQEGFKSSEEPDEDALLTEIRKGIKGKSIPVLVVTNVFKDKAQIERVKK